MHKVEDRHTIRTWRLFGRIPILSVIEIKEYWYPGVEDDDDGGEELDPPARNIPLTIQPSPRIH